MGITDTRTERRTLKSVTDAAWARNGWDILAIARTSPEKPILEGICAFVYTPEGSEPMYGTAFWTASGPRLNFEWIHNELPTHRHALDHFLQRAKRGF